MHVLVIEEESRLTEVLRFALGRAGFVVDAVRTDAREARIKRFAMTEPIVRTKALLRRPGGNAPLKTALKQTTQSRSCG